jgi:hypothetical protein
MEQERNQQQPKLAAPAAAGEMKTHAVTPPPPRPATPVMPAPSSWPVVFTPTWTSSLLQFNRGHQIIKITDNWSNAVKMETEALRH